MNPQGVPEETVQTIGYGFLTWLNDQGCDVETTQEDDGSGYVVIDVRLPDGDTYHMSVDV